MGAVGFLVLAVLAVAGLWAGWGRLVSPPTPQVPTGEGPAREAPAGRAPAAEFPGVEFPGAEAPRGEAAGERARSDDLREDVSGGEISREDEAWRLTVSEEVLWAGLDRWFRRGDTLLERAAAAVPASFGETRGGAEGTGRSSEGIRHAAGRSGAGTRGTLSGGDEVAAVSPRFRDAWRPRLAIVIDDWGYPWAAAADFLSLPVPLTVAVIPHLPLSAQQAQEAEARGHQVLLHLPMEPLNGSVPLEPDTVRVDMSPAQVLRILDRALASVPWAVGVNNHMGSKATAHPPVMYPLLADLGRRGLFFLDSATTPRSVAAEAAGAHGVPLAVNRVFLDSVPEEEAVAERLRAAMELALRTGEAVAIGHVRPETYRALARMLPEVQAAGIELVHVSELARPPRAPVGEGNPLARRIHRDSWLSGRLNGVSVAFAVEPATGPPPAIPLARQGSPAHQRPAAREDGHRTVREGRDER